MTRPVRRLKPYLADRYGAAVAASVLRFTDKQYRALRERVPRFRGLANIYNVIIRENIVIVSFYLGMKSAGKPIHDAIGVLVSATRQLVGRVPRFFRPLVRRFLFGRLFLAYMNRCSKLTATHPGGWKIRYVRDGIRDWHFECRECGVMKFYAEHRVPELRPFCNFFDFVQSRGLSNNADKNT